MGLYHKDNLFASKRIPMIEFLKVLVFDLWRKRMHRLVWQSNEIAIV